MELKLHGSAVRSSLTDHALRGYIPSFLLNRGGRELHPDRGWGGVFRLSCGGIIICYYVCLPVCSEGCTLPSAGSLRSGCSRKKVDV